MSDLLVRFEKATQDIKTLTRKPDNDTLLELYALYKQATTGDAGGSRPGAFDMVGRAKFSAWEKLKGTSKDQAMQRYIDLVGRLLSK